MKKRLLSFFAAALFIASVSVPPARAAATSGSCGANVQFGFDASSGTLTLNGTGAMTDYKSYPSAPWSSYRTSIRSVVIGSGVTSIGQYAFYQCTNLTSVTIPNGVETIGQYAFYQCSGLTSVTIPNGVKTIGLNAFRECSGLVSVTIPNGVETIGYGAFRKCGELVSVSVPPSVAQVGEGAFSDCEKLAFTSFGNARYLGNVSQLYLILVSASNPSISSCTIHDQTKVIHSAAFRGCANLSSVTVPDGVVSIAEYAFAESGLTRAVIGSGVTSIGKRAFWACESLTSVTVRDSAVNIGESAFSANPALTEFHMGYRATAIGGSAFGGCVSLPEIIIPATVTNIDNNAFRNCAALTAVYYGGTPEQRDALTVGSYNDPLLNAEWRYPLESVSVQTLPDQTEYEVGEDFRSQGLTLLCRRADGAETVTDSDYTYLADTSVPGIRTVTVTYFDRSTGENRTTAFEIRVNAAFTAGDLNGDGEVTAADAIYLLYHTFYPEDYPLGQDGDFDQSGAVTSADAIYLLYHTFYPDDYPLP